METGSPLTGFPIERNTGPAFGLYVPSESTTISAVADAASLVPKRYRILIMDSEVAFDVSWSNT